MSYYIVGREHPIDFRSSLFLCFTDLMTITDVQTDICINGYPNSLAAFVYLLMQKV